MHLVKMLRPPSDGERHPENALPLQWNTEVIHAWEKGNPSNVNGEEDKVDSVFAKETF